MPNPGLGHESPELVVALLAPSTVGAGEPAPATTPEDACGVRWAVVQALSVVVAPRASGQASQHVLNYYGPRGRGADL